MSAKGIVALVTRGIGGPQGLSYLVQVPPQCDDQPSIFSQLRNALSGEPGVAQRTALIAADAVADERALVDSTIRQWAERDAQVGARMQTASTRWGSAPPHERLNEFFRDCVRRSSACRVLLLNRFDSLFERMSGPLLAVMRDLEMAGELLGVNISTLTYDALYERRSLVEPGFVSDYGQEHVRLAVGRLSRDDAERMWQERAIGPLDDRFGRACFELAYEYSGALPGVLRLAQNHLATLLPSRDLPAYRDVLRRELPDAFGRVLRWDEHDARGERPFLAAVVAIHRGCSVPADWSLVRSHPWADVIVSDGEAGRLPSIAPPLGMKAAKMSAELGLTGAPEDLYRAGSYQACLDQVARDPVSPLSMAARMMLEVYGVSAACDLYFHPDVRWRIVGSLARDAGERCTTDEGRLEFERWRRVASALEDIDDGPAPSADSVLRVAVRIAAITRDSNPVTSAYVAVPVIEEALRVYLRSLTEEPPELLLASMAEGDLHRWWSRPEPFRRPLAGQRVSGVCLALTAAVLSEKDAHPLFDSPAALGKLIGVLDSRNLLGHTVVTPEKSMARRLSDAAARILDEAARRAGVRFTSADVERWLQPPLKFLDTLP